MRPARNLFPAICGAAALLIGAAGFIGWLADQPMLTQFRSDSIPIAPNTAAGFLVMGASLLTLSVRGSKRLRFVAVGLGGLVVILTSLRLFEFFTGRDFGV